MSFFKHYRAEQAELVESGMSKEDVEKQALLFKKAQELLRQWEAKDVGLDFGRR